MKIPQFPSLMLVVEALLTVATARADIYVPTDVGGALHLSDPVRSMAYVPYAVAMSAP